MKTLYTIACFILLAQFININDINAQRTEVTFYTTKGDFKVLLYDSLTTVTVDSFLARVGRKFYDGLIFHRVIKNFMIQGGDPTGTGSGGTGTTIPDEFHPSLKNIPGALAMANTGSANTGDCQFFINVVTNVHLDNKHTVFGMVTHNYSVVDTISKVATGAANKPVVDVKMDSIRVTKWPASVGNVATTPGTPIIYPSPSTGMVNIRLKNISHAVVTDITGKVYADIATENVDILEVDMSRHPKGFTWCASPHPRV